MPLPSLENFRAVWIEKTKASHGHGGPGWEFGTCLWSPTTDKSNKQIYRNMQAAHEGDLVLHFYEDTPFGRAEDHYFCGMSVVESPAIQTSQAPPLPGDWSNRDSYFRVPLKDFVPFNEAIALRDFVKQNHSALEAIAKSTKKTPFVRYREEIRLAQGKYLSECTPALFQLLSSSLDDELKAFPPPLVKQSDNGRRPFDYEEYVEGQRSKREATYFIRNPALVRDAKAHYGAVCQACAFQYDKRYKNLGEGYIEIHHLNPLSEKADAIADKKFSKLDQVTALCANCHRMIHRLIRKEKRAIQLEEFKRYLQT